MTARASRVVEEALSLPRRERIRIVERLISSLDTPSTSEIDRLQAEEAEDRIDALDRGEIGSRPAKQALDEIRGKLHR